MIDTLVVKLHLFGVAFWLGVVGVEFLIERRRALSREHGYLVARLHERIDLCLEMPAFLLVLVTGLLMLDMDRLSGVYLIKVLAGMLAVGGNLLCLWPVIRRKLAADRGDLQAVIDNSAVIDRISVIAIPAGLLAFACGVWLVISRY
ncbi:MAG: hypothetical protein ACPG8O_04820 [Alcanivorax nanhaiticus]